MSDTIAYNHAGGGEGAVDDIPASRTQIERLAEAGIIDAQATRAAIGEWRASLAWWPWIERLALALGASLVLAGIVFFIAFNWAKLTPALKFGLVEILLAASVGGAVKLDLQSLAGKICLLAASVLVGAFLAVFGQVYQTGADAYQLFMVWTALILVWVIVSRFPGLWMFWLLLVQVSLHLYWIQAYMPSGHFNQSWLFLLLAGLCIAPLLAREALFRRGWAWLAPIWPRWLLLAAALFYLLLLSIVFIFDNQGHTLANGLGLMLFMATVAAAMLYFRRRCYDLLSLAICTLAADIVIVSAAGKLLLYRQASSVMLLCMAVIVLAVFSLSTIWLLRVRQAAAAEALHG